jgi:aspartate racemase
MKDGMVGIIGGLGPEATIDLLRKIVKNTPAKTDEDHIPIVVYSNPKTPSRYRAILEGGESPVPYLVEAAKKLEQAGAEFLAIACNLAHYYYEDIERAVKIPVLHIVRETVSWISENYSVTRVGVLAPTPTLRVGLYQKELKSAGYEPVILNGNQTKKLVDEAIYSETGIKAGYIKENAELISEALNALFKRGSEIVILACTELPLVVEFLDDDIRKRVVDPTDILAKKIVKISKNLQ